ncbi:MAG: hypothetical protein HY900_33240 [Deltaproteobacteria bacterium]|nr:hypothetical protein [Deltaproteobacteria bacterium]
MRMLRKGLFTIVGTAAAVAFLAAPGWANMGHGCGHGKGGYDPARLEEHVKEKVDHFLGAVEATDEQRQKIYGVRDRAIPLLKEQMELKQKAMELRKQENPDANEFYALVDRKADLAKQLFDLKSEGRALLTPEQRQKAKQMHTDMHGKGMHGKGMHGGMHGMHGGMHHGMRCG